MTYPHSSLLFPFPFPFPLPFHPFNTSLFFLPYPRPLFPFHSSHPLHSSLSYLHSPSYPLPFPSFSFLPPLLNIIPSICSLYSPFQHSYPSKSFPCTSFLSIHPLLPYSCLPLPALPSLPCHLSHLSPLQVTSEQREA